MEYTDDLDRMQTLLNEHRGWSAMLWKFRPSRRRLILRVYCFQKALELYVV
jgi:phage-related protein